MPSRPSNKTMVRVGYKTAVFMYRHPRTRRATLVVLRPTAKAGWRVGKVVAKRKARQRVAVATADAAARLDAAGTQLQLLGERSQLGGQLLMVYGPMAAEVLGLIEPPKPRRTVLKVTVGIVIGAVAMYFLEPERRRRLQQLGGRNR